MRNQKELNVFCTSCLFIFAWLFAACGSQTRTSPEKSKSPDFRNSNAKHTIAANPGTYDAKRLKDFEDLSNEGRTSLSAARGDASLQSTDSSLARNSEETNLDSKAILTEVCEEPAYVYIEAGCYCSYRTELCTMINWFDISILDKATKQVLWGPEGHRVIMHNDCNFMTVLGKEVKLPKSVLARTADSMLFQLHNGAEDQTVPFYPPFHSGRFGLQGAPGPKGDLGPKGNQGDKGEPGPQGIAGAKGDKGDLGNRGKDGAPGERGLQGLSGVKGDPGVAGSKGDTGPQGLTGPRGEIGPLGVQGPKGDTGLTGALGPIGKIGPQGPKGDIGNTGIVGPQGPRGELGATGAKGDKGDTGASGPQGPRGDAGPVGPQGPVGPKGDQGEVGPRGPRGETGPPGVSPSLF